MRLREPGVTAKLRTLKGYRKDYLENLYIFSKMADADAIVEIGSCFGSSAITLAWGSPRAVVYCIDPSLNPNCKGDPEKQIQHSCYDIFCEEVARVGLADRLVQVPSTSAEALKTIAPKLSMPIDLLYVDGEHSYEGVKIDCRWMDYVRPGGYAVFDDWIEPVERAVREYLRGHYEWSRANTPDFPRVFQKVPLIGDPWRERIWHQPDTNYFRAEFIQRWFEDD